MHRCTESGTLLFRQILCLRVAMLENPSPDSGNLSNFESIQLQMFSFSDLAKFW